MEKDLEKGSHSRDAGAVIQNPLSEDAPALTTAADIDESRCNHVRDKA